MGTCVHFSRSLPSNSWWQTMAGWQVLSRPSAAEGGGRRPAFTGTATQPYSATEVDGWQHKAQPGVSKPGRSTPEYMSIADQLETHAQQELKHALIISRQIDYLGKMPSVAPKPVQTSEKAKEMLRFDLENENETIRNYRTRVRQCEALGEFAMAEQIRQILVDEQDHQIDLATALGEEVPDLTKTAR